MRKKRIITNQKTQEVEKHFQGVSVLIEPKTLIGSSSLLLKSIVKFVYDVLLFKYVTL